MQVSVGFSGYYRPDAFLPIHVRLSNTGATISASLDIVDAIQQSTAIAPYNRVTYSQAVVLPQAATKEVALYVPGADLGQSITVALDANGTTLAQQAVPLSPVPDGAELVGVLSRSPATRVQLKSFGGSLGGVQLLVVPMDAGSLDPQPLTLANLDVMCLTNFDTNALSADQFGALETWVRSGGTLIEVGGPTAQETVSGLPPSLRPISLSPPQTLLHAPSLAKVGGSALPSGELIAATGAPLNARTLLDAGHIYAGSQVPASSSRPLVVQRFVGLGSVVYSALDPTLQPLASWGGVQAYWTFLAATSRAGAATLTTSFAGANMADSSTNATSTINSEISSIAPPSITLFVILLGIYVAGLIPLNFVLLNHLRHRDWSWITLPALAVLLVLAVFGGAYYGRGRDLQTEVVSVEYLNPGSSLALGQSYVGLISPAAGAYTITPDDSSLLAAPLFYNQAQYGVPSDIGNAASPIQVAEQSAQVTMPDMSSWSNRSVSFSGVFSNQPHLSSSLTVSGTGVIVGRVTNLSNATFYGVLVQAFGSTFQYLGDMPPGSTRAVALDTTGASGNQGTISQDYAGVSYLPQPSATNSLSALDSGHATGLPQATLRAPAQNLLSIGMHLLAAGTSVPLSPNESVSQRYQNISQAVLGTTTGAAFNAVLAVGWTINQPETFSVNGSHPNRVDTDMVVQSFPVQLAEGSFALDSGTLPARLVGSDQTFQSPNGSGITLSPGSSAYFVATLPPTSRVSAHVLLNSLTISVGSYGAGGSLSDQTASLWDWTAGIWKPVDVTTGEVTVNQPGRFVNGAGVIRVRISAQSGDLNLSDPNTGVSLGVSGEVR